MSIDQERVMPEVMGNSHNTYIQPPMLRKSLLLSRLAAVEYTGSYPASLPVWTPPIYSLDRKQQTCMY